MAHESCHEIHMVYLSWDVLWGHFKIHGENIDVLEPCPLLEYMFTKLFSLITATALLKSLTALLEYLDLRDWWGS